MKAVIFTRMRKVLLVYSKDIFCQIILISSFLYLIRLVESTFRGVGFLSTSFVEDFFLVIPYSLALGFFFGKKAKLLFNSLFILFNVFLSGFYLSTSRLLGEEILRYTVIESALIIDNAITINLFFVFLAELSLGCFLLFYSVRFNQIFNSYSKITGPLSVVILVLLLFVLKNNVQRVSKSRDIDRFENKEVFFKANNKLKYLINEVSFYYKDNSFQSDLGWDCNEEVPRQIDCSFPLLKNGFDKSSIAPFFKPITSPPNIVFIVVESLSSSFSGPTNYLGSYTPFLDSLRSVSMVWENTLSGAAKTYGVLPNLLSGLPYGDDLKGVINREGMDRLKFPSIIDQLGVKYNSSFFYGGWSGFDKMSSFMKVLGVDRVYDEKYFQNKESGITKFKWGYNDFILLTEAANKFVESDSNSVDVIMTLAIHNPYDQKLDSRLFNEKLKLLTGSIHRQEIARSILLSDFSIQKYFEIVSKSKKFQNSIFIITGDHNIGSDLVMKSPLEIYRVPLLLYSPLLLHAKSSLVPVSHRDVCPSLVSLLKESGQITASPVLNTGTQLNTSGKLDSNKLFSFELFSKGLPTVYRDDFFISGANLYKVSDEKLNSERCDNDSIKKRLITEKKYLIKRNKYCLGSNKIIP